MADATGQTDAPLLTTLTTGSLAELVARARPPERRTTRPKRLAVFGRAPGIDRVETEDGTFEVVTVRSELELRERLFRDRRDDALDGRIFVLSWPEGGGILPLDLRPAFAGERVLRLVARDRLQQHLGGRRVLEEVASSELGQLLDGTPRERFPAYDAPVVDVPGAWRLLLGASVGLPIVSRRDGATLLLWSLIGRGGSAFASQIKATKRLEGELQRYLAQDFGPLAHHAWRAFEKETARAFVIAGVVVDALRTALDGDELTPEERGAADLRIRELKGEHAIPDNLVEAWGTETVTAVRDLALRGARCAALGLPELAAFDVGTLLRECDQRTVHLSDRLVAKSDLLPRARGARLHALASHAAAVAAAATPDARALEETRARRDAVLRHVELADHRLPAARGALAIARLVAYLVCERRGTLARAPRAEGDVSLADWAAFQVEHGGAVSRALRELASVHVPELLLGTNAVRDAIRASRARANRAFATKLQSYHGAGAPALANVLLLHEVGARYVAKFLEDGERSLFVLLLDGLSYGVACELFESLRDLGWGPTSVDWSQAPHGLPLPVLSALPSITSVSRSAFFSGEVPAAGTPEPGTDQDAARWSRHPALSKFTPELFLKKAIGTGTDLPIEVATAIRDRGRRLVGAVVNAVDDWLSGPQQIAHGFTVDVVKPLRAILSLCHEAGRTVLVVADHGHTLDEGVQLGERGEHARWRVPGEPLVEGELVFRGPKVWAPPGGSEVVLPFLSGTTYKFKKVGHHGGATLEEVVVPAVFLDVNGAAFPTPHWWSLEAGASAPVTRPTVAPAEGSLFAPPVPKGGLAARLVATEVWTERKKLLPGRFQEEKLYALLDAMEKRSKLSAAEFTEITGEAERRMGGFAAQAGLALNVDGVEVLSHDREARRLVLDVALLEQVFEVPRG